MQSNLSLVRESLAREVWLATIMVRRPWRGRQTASRADRELPLTWRMLQKNDIRERLAKRPVGVVTGSSRADSHNFLRVRRSGLSELRSRYAVLLLLEVRGLVVDNRSRKSSEGGDHSRVRGGISNCHVQSCPCNAVAWFPRVIRCHSFVLPRHTVSIPKTTSIHCAPAVRPSLEAVRRQKFQP